MLHFTFIHIQSHLSQAVYLGSEVVISVVEIHVGDASYHNGSYSGSINAIKGFIFAANMAVWVGICVHYYNKINRQLSSGGSSASVAPIKKLLRSVLICAVIAFTYKAFFGLNRIGQNVIHMYPPCAGHIVDVIHLMFCVIQAACLAAQMTGGGGKNKVSSTTTTTTTTTSTSEENA